MLLLSPIKSFSHCQVPCGIYEDSLRIQLIDEHITTIEKSITEINALSAQSTPNYNQIVRWVNNKELHANKIQTIVSEYFLYQRIKMVSKDNHHYGDYLKSLEYLHQISVYAMKSKQSTDLKLIPILRKTIQLFSAHYFSGHKH
jgi:nickel superoxide dismutase